MTEITEEMIDEGAERAWELRGFDPRYIAEEVFKAMVVFRFVASNTNTGPVMINGRVVDMKLDGKPVRAGDLVAGRTYEYDRSTGEVKPWITPRGHERP